MPPMLLSLSKYWHKRFYCDGSIRSQLRHKAIIAPCCYTEEWRWHFIRCTVEGWAINKWAKHPLLSVCPEVINSMKKNYSRSSSGRSHEQDIINTWPVRCCDQPANSSSNMTADRWKSELKFWCQFSSHKKKSGRKRKIDLPARREL